MSQDYSNESGIGETASCRREAQILPHEIRMIINAVAITARNCRITKYAERSSALYSFLASLIGREQKRTTLYAEHVELIELHDVCIYLPWYRERLDEICFRDSPERLLYQLLLKYGGLDQVLVSEKCPELIEKIIDIWHERDLCDSFGSRFEVGFDVDFDYRVREDYSALEGILILDVNRFVTLENYFMDSAGNIIQLDSCEHFDVVYQGSLHVMSGAVKEYPAKLNSFSTDHSIKTKISVTFDDGSTWKDIDEKELLALIPLAFPEMLEE